MSCKALFDLSPTPWSMSTEDGIIPDPSSSKNVEGSDKSTGRVVVVFTAVVDVVGTVVVFVVMSRAT